MKCARRVCTLYCFLTQAKKRKPGFRECTLYCFLTHNAARNFSVDFIYILAYNIDILTYESEGQTCLTEKELLK